MKKVWWLAAGIAAASCFLYSSVQPPRALSAARFGQIPPHFEPTREGAFAARGAGFALEVDRGGANVQVARRGASAAMLLKLEGASPSGARPENLLPGVSNYFLGDDPRSWRTGVPHYARVRYENVYPGVDLVYYGAAGTLEYDFLLAPGADPGLIRMSYEGARSVRIDDAGNLRIALDGGELVHHRPVSYQLVDGARRGVESAFRILREAGRALVSFELGAYDVRLPLTIDPVLTYATYLGGSNDLEDVGGMAVDAAGAVYVAGRTNSLDFPATAGAVQTGLGGGFGYDSFVAKLNPAGTAFEYISYLGGSGTEETMGLRIDAGGNAYVAGSTSSADFPVTAGAAQEDLGGADDVFLAKLNATGGTLLYATYLGGAGSEPASARLGGFEIDADGDAYVYGDTDSSDYPVSANAPQPVRGNPNAAQFDEDVFLARLNAAGTEFTFSTYHGGSAIEGTDDDIFDTRLLAIDGAGNAWIAGSSESADLPTTTGAFDETFGGPASGNPGGGDAFVAKFDTNAGTLLYGTYLGGAGDEFAKALAVDAAGSAYVAVNTGSNDYPVSAGAPDNSFAGGTFDIGITKLNAAGSAVLYSTYLGGGLLDAAGAIRVDSTGALFVAGETRTTAGFLAGMSGADTTHNGGADGFIAKLNPAGAAWEYASFAGSSDDETVYLFEIDAAGSAYAVLGDPTGDAFLSAGGTAHSGGWDDYLVKVNPAGDAFLDASYLGGSLDDFATAMVVDADQNVYLAGQTQSSNYPTTAGVPQPDMNGIAGDQDMYIAKLATTPAGPVAQPGTLALSQAAYDVAEDVGTASFTVTRTGGTSGAVSVTCTAASGGADTATAGADYTAAAATLNWANGDGAAKTCSVAIADDDEVEGDETFTVTLGNPTGGAALGANDSATVTLGDDDSPPVPQPGTVQFNPAAYSRNENGGSVTLTLTRTSGADGAISVSVASGGGSASAGADYTALAGTVSWADGDSADKTVVLAILDDTLDEPNETVMFTLSGATGGALLGTATATVTIVDDEVPPPPAEQDVRARARYGGSLDAGFLALLAGLLVSTRLARQRALRRAMSAAAAVGCAMALSLGSPATRADDAAGNWYVGLRGGLATTTQTTRSIETELAARGHDVDARLDDHGAAYALFGGYRWDNGFALETSYFDLGDFEIDVSGTSERPAALLGDTERLLGEGGRGVSAAVAWTIRVGEHFGITPRVGAYYWSSRHRVAGPTRRITDREFGIDFMGGVSLDWRLNDNWSLGLGYEGWAAADRNDVRVVNAALTYRFGD